MIRELTVDVPQYNEMIGHLQTAVTAEEQEGVLNDIVASFMRVVEKRVLGKTYVSFDIPMLDVDTYFGVPATTSEVDTIPTLEETYHDRMREVARETIKTMTPKFNPKGPDRFEVFMMGAVRHALRTFMEGLGGENPEFSTLHYIYLLQHKPTADEAERLNQWIVSKNERLIVKYIRRYYATYIKNHMDDMMQCGRMAMLEKSGSYSFYKRGKDGLPYHFSTYITSYIVNALKEYLCQHAELTQHYVGRYKKLNQTLEHLANIGIENPTLEEIAKVMGVGIAAVQEALSVKAHLNPVSIEGDEKDKNLSDPYTTSPEYLFERTEMEEEIHDAIKQLSDDQRKVVEAIYFSGDSNRTFPEVSRMLNMDVVRVRRLHNQAKREMEYSLSVLGYSSSAKRRALENAADSLDIEFVLSADAVEANLELAMSADVLDPLF